MSNLSLVQRNNHNEESDAQAGDKTAAIEESEILGSCLKSSTETEYQSSTCNCPTTSVVITNRSSEESAKEGTRCKERNDRATKSCQSISLSLVEVIIRDFWYK